jgi:hypothetical protein
LLLGFELASPLQLQPASHSRQLLFLLSPDAHFLPEGVLRSVLTFLILFDLIVVGSSQTEKVSILGFLPVSASVYGQLSSPILAPRLILMVVGRADILAASQVQED